MSEMRKINKEPKGYVLESVGTYLRADGMTYPLGIDSDGFPYWISDNDDVDAATDGVHIYDIEPDGDWVTSLSDEDRHTVAWVDYNLKWTPVKRNWIPVKRRSWRESQ